MLRSLSAGVAGLLAAVLLPLALVSVWVDGVVTDTDEYVATVAPLADDEVVQAAAVEVLDRQALRLLADTGAAQAPGTDRLVHLVVQRVVESPAFRNVWVQANRTAHQQVVAVLEGRRDVRLDAQGRVTIDLSGVLGAIAQDLADQGLVRPGPASDVSASIPVMDADRLAKVRRGYDALQTLGFWLPVLWGAAVLLTLLLARRRLAATARLAVASLLSLGLLALALPVARDVLTEQLAPRDVAQAVWDVVVAGLWHQLEALAVVLAVVALAAGVLAVVLGRRRTASAT